MGRGVSRMEAKEKRFGEGRVMSRFSQMSTGGKRAWAVGMVLFFALLISAIGYSQWYAIHVNVPRYEKTGAP